MHEWSQTLRAGLWAIVIELVLILAASRDPVGYVQRVIITGALLAESSSVVDNKLNVQGGVVDTFQVGPDRLVTTTLVVLTQPGSSDTSPAIEATFTNPIGEAHQFQLEVPGSSLGGEIGFVCYPLELSVPTDGRYLLSLSAQGGFAALPVKVFSGDPEGRG